MKAALSIARIIVGLLFIFSGLIKANDPPGLSYKMQEFFDVWGLYGLNDYALVFSIIMNAFEIITGVAVLVGWQIRFFSWILLLLMIFFTFLTGYALLSGKIRECGCFGDCIPLKANQSFIKDLVLLVLTGFIFSKRNRVQSSIPERPSIVILFFTSIMVFSLQWYVLLHLPLLDCLPFKIGNSIPEKMKVPSNAVKDSIVITFVYKHNDKLVEFTAGSFPGDFNDTTYSFVKRYDKIIREGNAEPAIKDFSLQTIYGNDTTAALLNEDGYKLFLFLRNGYSTGEWSELLFPLIQTAEKKNIPGFIITNISIDELRKNPPDAFFSFTALACDATAIKTAARVNPTLYLVKKGIIMDKWGYADFNTAFRQIQTLQ